MEREDKGKKEIRAMEAVPGDVAMQGSGGIGKLCSDLRCLARVKFYRRVVVHIPVAV